MDLLKGALRTIGWLRSWGWSQNRIDSLKQVTGCLLLIISPCVIAGEMTACPTVSSHRGVFSAAKIYKDSLVTIEKGGADYPLKISLYRRKNGGCEKEGVAGYSHEGADPILDSLFFGKVNGAVNLFTIVRWDINHRGIGTFGSFYRVYAYKADEDGVLKENKNVTGNRAMSGMDGYEDGRSVIFPYKTAPAVRCFINKFDRFLK